jgi:hypothetical protein
MESFLEGLINCGKRLIVESLVDGRLIVIDVNP